MAKYSIEGTTLTNIANPLRTLRGVTGGMTPEEMASNANTVQANVTNALAKVAEKGVTVPSGANSDDLAELIESIPKAQPIPDVVYFYITIKSELYYPTIAITAVIAGVERTIHCGASGIGKFPVYFLCDVGTTVLFEGAIASVTPQNGASIVESDATRVRLDVADGGLVADIVNISSPV